MDRVSLLRSVENKSENKTSYVVRKTNKSGNTVSLFPLILWRISWFGLQKRMEFSDLHQLSSRCIGGSKFIHIWPMSGIPNFHCGTLSLCGGFWMPNCLLLMSYWDMAMHCGRNVPSVNMVIFWSISFSFVRSLCSFLRAYAAHFNIDMPISVGISGFSYSTPSGSLLS